MNSWMKIPYERNGKKGIRYSRKTPANKAYIIVRTDRVPENVRAELEYKERVETPEVTKPCLFCDSQATMEKYYNAVMIPLCEFHYYNRNIGKIAEQIRKEEERHGNDAKVSKISKQKSKSKVA